MKYEIIRTYFRQICADWEASENFELKYRFLCSGHHEIAIDIKVVNPESIGCQNKPELHSMNIDHRVRPEFCAFE